MALPRRSGPARRRGRLAPEFAADLEAQIRAALAPPRRQTCAQWAAENRYLSAQESAEPGRWRNERVPYLVGPMEAFSAPSTEIVVIVAGAQSAKTEGLLNALGYWIDQDPGPALIIYPTEKAADKVVRNRVHPLLTGSESLRRHLSGSSDDLGLKEIHLDACTIYSGWANSPQALATTPIRYVILDEVDKYPAYSGREANPIKLAHVRTRTYRGRRKLGIVSTPTLDTGNIWQEWQRSSRHAYQVPCPRCGWYQVLDFFGGVKWEKDTPTERLTDPGHVWYECSKCHERISEGERLRMLAAGAWVPDGATIGRGPPPELVFRRVMGFHISALYSPWVTLGEVAREFRESIGDRSRLMNFWNSWLALPWKEKVEGIDQKKILNRRAPYDQGTVPQDAVVLTAGVDVGGDVKHFVIRAWGARERSWLVRHGIATGWADVLGALQAGYKRADGTILHVSRALVDSGYDTEAVYKFCRANRPLTWPSKGSNTPGQVQTVKISRPEPGTLLYTFRADFWKDRVARFIAAPEGEPCEWRIPQDVSEEYVKQMASERRVLERRNGRIVAHWEPLTESTPNHYWDCEILAAVAADAEGVRYLEATLEAVAESRDGRTPRAPFPEREGGGAGWLQAERLLERGDSVW